MQEKQWRDTETRKDKQFRAKERDEADHEAHNLPFAFHHQQGRGVLLAANELKILGHAFAIHAS
jgi:hypothetical protein